MNSPAFARFPRKSAIRAAILGGFLPLLGGCKAIVLHPAGDVAMQQRDLLVISTLLMLLIIIPVMAATVIVAFRYRESNREATYAPDWDHSTALELVIWSVPLLIIICLGAITWLSTHTLDPFRPLERVDAQHRIVTPAQPPLDVDVVAMDWKWLFIYPAYDIATVNELPLPIDRPVRFHITATSMMNSFFIPAMAGQIYAMPGMETQLNAVLNKTGSYRGFSANYSGRGFSGMNFRTIGMEPAKFKAWVQATRGHGVPLSHANYLKLEKPSEDVSPMRFGAVAPELYGRILNRCVHPGETCISQVMHQDKAKGAEVPVNATLPNARNPEGGAMQKPKEQGTSPNIAEPPPANPPGNAKPDSKKNRGLTLNDAPSPLSRPTAHA